MWSPNDIQAMAESLQAFASLIALPYIALQVRHAKNDARRQNDHAAELARLQTEQLSHQVKASEEHAVAAEAAVYHGFIDLMMRIELCLVRYPEIRAYFYGGATMSSNTPTDPRVLVVAEMLRDLEDHVAKHEHFLDTGSFTGWQRYFEFIRENSPVYCQFCSDTSDWYADGDWGMTRSAIAGSGI